MRALAVLATSLAVGVAPPPSPSTWPRYPSFTAQSCWGRSLGGGALRAAPSFPPSGPRLAPEAIVRRVLAGLGDRRYVGRVVLAAPPPITVQHLRGYFAGARPPTDAEWAYVSVRRPKSMIAEWEAGLVAGALRDDFCAARGRPLVGWTIGGRGGITVSDKTQALGQRFPNPSPAGFRRALAQVAKAYDFRVVSLRLLRPLQLAPLLVVETNRSRKAFVADVSKIVAALDPTSSAGHETAITFEGFFLEARDAKGAFVRVDDVHRGQTEGGQWSWSRCAYPYATLGGPIGPKPCP